MSARNARRRAAGRGGPAPELVAALVVVVLYGAALALGPATLAAVDPGPGRTAAPTPTPAAAPTASANLLRSDILALIEFDARLTRAGEELRAIRARSPFRGSEVAFVLRRINTTLLPAIGRAGRLALDPASQEVGAQLEVLYASAATTIERASDLSLGSDPAYREAAREIIVLFNDLPAIDARLNALLKPAVSSTAAPTRSPTATASAGPTASAPPGSFVPPSTALPSPHPGELLQDPGFETGIGPWTLHTSGSGVGATTRPAAPLGPVGLRSLQVDLQPGVSLADVGVGQGSIRLQAGRRYIAAVSIRSTVARSAQLRVVGPTEETYGIAIVEIGTESEVAFLDFQATFDVPSATFWIDLGGPVGGIVWLDNASLAPVAPA